MKLKSKYVTHKCNIQTSGTATTAAAAAAAHLVVKSKSHLRVTQAAGCCQKSSAAGYENKRLVKTL